MGKGSVGISLEYISQNTSERIKMRSFGIFLMFIYPGAYVEFQTENMDFLPPLKRLAIYCAGVWHNFLTFVICALISVYLGFLITPFYKHAVGGVTVSWVDQSSGFSKTVAPGFTITQLNDCPISSEASWSSCLVSIMESTDVGYCFPIGELNGENELNQTCCQSAEDALKNSNFCFESQISGSLCLSARKVAGSSPLFCREESEWRCPNRASVCLRPKHWALEEKLFKVSYSIPESAETDYFMFVGHPSELWNLSKEKKKEYSFISKIL